MRRNWIKLYVDQCLRGTMMSELSAVARCVWIWLLLMAGDSNVEGTIFLRKGEDGKLVGYSDQTLSELLAVDISVFKLAKRKMKRFKKIAVDRSNVIKVLNWKKYQSEYSRQKIYRSTEEGDKKNSNSNCNPSNSLELDRDKDKEEDKNNMSEKTFDILWKDWPKEGRFLQKYCLMKFKALVKAGKLDDFRATTIGYFEYRKHKKLNENFEPQVMHLKTWMNNWEGEKDTYMGFEYKPRL